MTNCTFCQQPFIKDNLWLHCKTCNVSYYADRIQGIHIKWERTIGDFSWALNIYPDANRSALMGFRASTVHDSDLILKQFQIDHAIQNVNPDNVVDKIKHILIFS
jgi:hypothetical protein